MILLVLTSVSLNTFLILLLEIFISSIISWFPIWKMQVWLSLTLVPSYAVTWVISQKFFNEWMNSLTGREREKERDVFHLLIHYEQVMLSKSLSWVARSNHGNYHCFSGSAIARNWGQEPELKIELMCCMSSIFFIFFFINFFCISENNSDRRRWR